MRSLWVSTHKEEIAGLLRRYRKETKHICWPASWKEHLGVARQPLQPHWELRVDFRLWRSSAPLVWWGTLKLQRLLTSQRSLRTATGWGSNVLGSKESERLPRRFLSLCLRKTYCFLTEPNFAAWHNYAEIWCQKFAIQKPSIINIQRVSRPAIQELVVGLWSKGYDQEQMNRLLKLHQPQKAGTHIYKESHQSYKWNQDFTLADLGGPCPQLRHHFNIQLWPGLMCCSHKPPSSSWTT